MLPCRPQCTRPPFGLRPRAPVHLVNREGSAYGEGRTMAVWPHGKASRLVRTLDLWKRNFGHQRVVGAFGGVTGDKTGSAAFILEERPVQKLGLLDHITGGLAFMIRALEIVAMIPICGSRSVALFMPEWSRIPLPTFLVASLARRTGRLSRPVQSRCCGTTEATAS